MSEPTHAEHHELDALVSRLVYIALADEIAATAGVTDTARRPGGAGGSSDAARSEDQAPANGSGPSAYDRQLQAVLIRHFAALDAALDIDGLLRESLEARVENP